VLERCILEWRPKATSLFDCTTLKDVFVNRYKGKDLSGFGKLTKLESLAILNSPVRDLRGLITLKRLRRLRLNNLTKLASLVGLEELTNLEELDLRGERAIRSIEELGSLSRLRRLYLDDNGDIESLGPLDKLSALEVVTFSGSTKIIDGDLSPLVRLKSLTGITFQNRRHYSHRREEFGDAYWKP